MRHVRKLFFQNAAGERWGLNGENGVYATALAGFGLALTPSFSDLGNGFFPISKAAESQAQLAFTVVITRNAYAVHQALVDWLATSGTLTLVYNPTGTQEYHRDVSISYMQKGELTKVGWLELPCSFSCITPWYRPVPTAVSISNSDPDAIRRYHYRYTNHLRYGADNATALRATIAGAGHIPGALQLTFRGAVTSPRIRLTGTVSGKTFGVCRLSAILEASDTLVFSTRYEHAYVKKIGADGTEIDLLDALDLSLGPFFHIPVNEPCTLSIEADTPVTGRASLLIYYYYRSV